jgi:hypothetical protein
MSQGNEPSPLGTARPHLLCDHCRSFWERATCLNFGFEQLYAGGPDVPPMPQHLFHSSRSSVRAAAQSGCHFCSILLGSLEGCTGDHEPREPHHEDDPIYVSTNLLNQDEGTFLMTLFCCEQAQIVSHDQIASLHSLRICPSNGEKSNSNAAATDCSQMRLPNLPPPSS